MLKPILTALHTVPANTPLTIDPTGFAHLRLLMREALTGDDQPLTNGPGALLGVPIVVSKYLPAGTFMFGNQIHRWRDPTLDEMVDDAKRRLADFIDSRIEWHLTQHRKGVFTC